MAKKGRRATEEERILAVQLIESGRKIDEVVEIMGVGRRTVLEWWQKYREGGLAALSTKFASGRPTTLDDRQMLELRALLLGSDPRQHSLGFALWTRSLVAELIWVRFNRRLSEVTVGRILKKLGMSPQRPVYRANQQDPERVRIWKEEVYPKIRKEAAECGAVVLFADEAAVRTDFHAGTTWGAVGQTPVVKATGERKSIMMVSAISSRGHLRFRLHEGSFRAKHFIKFLQALLADFSEPVFLIVDGSSVHTAKEVSTYVASTGGRLKLFFLPPYSPELNPDEWVWKNIKNDKIGRAGVRGLDDLKFIARSALASLQKMPHVIRSFFLDPHLAYLRKEA
jgi:Transposase and inactivated derivatives